MPSRKTTDKTYQELIQEVDMIALRDNVQAFFRQFPDPRKRWIYPSW